MYKIAIALLLGLLIGFLFVEKTEIVQIEGTAWCFHSEYKDLDSYQSVNFRTNTMINVYNKKVHVYAECNNF